MRVRVLFFAMARESAGCNSADLSMPDGSTVGDARRAIGEKFPSLKERLRHFRMALNQEFTDSQSALHDGAELAVIPPVSGG